MAKKHIELINNELKDCKTILDIGCGNCYTEKQLSFGGKQVTGVDIEKVKWNREILDKFVLYDGTKGLLRKFRANSFDCVMALDFIEHLTKEDGLKLISEMEKIAKKRVIIQTLNGFIKEKEEYSNKNKYDKHISGWDAEEFENSGYNVTGTRGLKSVALKAYYRKSFFLRFLAYISSYIVSNPKKTFELLCIKHVKELKNGE